MFVVPGTYIEFDIRNIMSNWFLDRLIIDLSTLLFFGASVEGEFLRDK